MRKLPLAIISCGALVLTGSAATASQSYKSPAWSVPEIVELNSQCSPYPTWDMIEFSLAKFTGTNQTPIPDDGKTLLEVHRVNGRWIVPTGLYEGEQIVTNGGENRLRFHVSGLTAQGIVWDEIRLRHDGWGSNVVAFEMTTACK